MRQAVRILLRAARRQPTEVTASGDPGHAAPAGLPDIR
jgi:hypothetical protein